MAGNKDRVAVLTEVPPDPGRRLLGLNFAATKFAALSIPPLLLVAFRSVSEGGPFFLTVDAYDPHAPWDPPEEYTNLYSDGATRARSRSPPSTAPATTSPRSSSNA